MDVATTEPPVPVGTPHCLVCGEPVEDDVMCCPRCDTPHHGECWDYNCGCAVYGCREASLRLGRCTMCDRPVTNAVRVPSVELVTYDRTGKAPLSPSLCAECSEAKILSGGRVPATAAAIVVVGCGAVLTLLGEHSLTRLGSWGALGVGLGALAGIMWLLSSLVTEMGRNAGDLPMPPRLTAKGRRKGDDEA